MSAIADKKAGVIEQPLTKELIAEFINAAKEGDIDKIQKLFAKDKRLINCQDNEDCTALHYAVEKNHHAVVVLLLVNNADTTIRDKGSYNPLEVAVKNNNIALVNLLIVKATLEMLKKALYVVVVPQAGKKKLSAAESIEQDEQTALADSIKGILKNEIRRREGVKVNSAQAQQSSAASLLTAQQQAEAMRLLTALQQLQPKQPLEKTPQLDNKKLPLNDDKHANSMQATEGVVAAEPAHLVTQLPKAHDLPRGVEVQLQPAAESAQAMHQQRKKQNKAIRKAKELQGLTDSYALQITRASTFFSSVWSSKSVWPDKSMWPDKKSNEHLAKLNAESKKGEPLVCRAQRILMLDDKAGMLKKLTHG